MSILDSVFWSSPIAPRQIVEAGDVAADPVRVEDLKFMRAAVARAVVRLASERTEALRSRDVPAAA